MTAVQRFARKFLQDSAIRNPVLRTSGCCVWIIIYGSVCMHKHEHVLLKNSMPVWSQCNVFAESYHLKENELHNYTTTKFVNIRLKLRKLIYKQRKNQSVRTKPQVLRPQVFNASCKVQAICNLSIEFIVIYKLQIRSWSWM